jgi:hypothetical protein
VTNFLQPRRNFDPSLGEIMDRPQGPSSEPFNEILPGTGRNRSNRL